MADISQINIPNGNSSTTYDINAKKVNGHTVGADVPSNAEFTDEKVGQVSLSDNADRPVLFGATGTSTINSNVGKNAKFTYNASTGNLKATKFNNYTLGAACAKSVDTTVISGSAKLVTSGGVYSALADKLKVELGNGSGAGTSFAMSVDSSKTNSCWLIFFGGTYVGVLTRFNNNITLTKLAGSITATATLETGSVITFTTSSVPWATLRYVTLFAG